MGLLAGRGCEVEAAPIRQLAKAVRAGQCDVVLDVDLDPGGKLQTAPDRSIGKSDGLSGRPPFRATIDCRADLIERASGRLQFLDLQKTLEMSLRVMGPAADAQRSRDQPLLHVVAHRTPR